MKDGLYYLTENGSLQAAETLPEAGEPGTLDTDRFIYQFCGGQYNGKMWLFPALEVRGLITGFTKDKKAQRAAGMLVYREELDNQPEIKGYNGPMYNGIDDATGRVIIRYEYN